MLEYFNLLMTWLSLALLVSALLCKVSTTGDYFVKLIFLYSSYFLTGTLLIPHGKFLKAFYVDQAYSYYSNSRIRGQGSIS